MALDNNGYQGQISSLDYDNGTFPTDAFTFSNKYISTLGIYAPPGAQFRIEQGINNATSTDIITIGQTFMYEAYNTHIKSIQYLGNLHAYSTYNNDTNSSTQLIVEIEPIQDTSGGDPSPSNVCPISGQTEITVNVENENKIYTVNWADVAGTVYGGSLNITTGVLTVDTLYIPFPATRGTAVTSNVRRWYTGKVLDAYGYTEVIACDSLKASSSYVINLENYISMTDDGRVAVTPTWGQSLTTVEAFNTALENHPINLVVKTSNTTTVQLTEQQISVLLNSNAGKITVKNPPSLLTTATTAVIRTDEEIYSLPASNDKRIVIDYIVKSESTT